MTARAMSWVPTLTAIVIALVVVSYNAYRWGRPDPSLMSQALRNVALFLGVGATGVFDDPAADTLASVPRTLLRRRALRALLGVLALAGGWTLLAAFAAARAPGIPTAALSVEAAGMIALGLVLGAVMVARGRTNGWVFAAPVVLFIRLATLLLPERWTLWGGAPADDVWRDAHRRWLVVMAVALVGVVLLSLDPARRRVIVRRR